MLQRLLLCLGLVTGAWLTGPLSASAQTEAAKPAATPDWIVTLGVEARMRPAYEGSDRYVVMPYPIIDIRRGGTPWQFSNPRDGFSFAVIDTGRFRMGPTGTIGMPRRESDDPALRGLGNIPWKVELGVFAEYWPLQWLRTRVELRQGVSGHHGFVSDLSADAVYPATERLILSAGPRLTLATANALEPYFGVTPEQSAASGLPVYSVSGGVRSLGFGVQAHEQWTEHWATRVYLEYDRLLGDVANSPIVARSGSPDQVTIGLGLSYDFDLTLP